MLEKPDIPISLVSNGVQQGYGLDVRQVVFLPLGYDINSAVYRVEALRGKSYFLKLRKGNFDPISVTLPRFLNTIGISIIIAPLETLTGQLYGKLDQYTTILYPFVPGKDGYEVQLTEQQWLQLGRALWMIHNTQLPTELANQIHNETYDPQWRENTRQFLSLINQVSFDDPIAKQLSEFMQAKREVIDQMVGRAEELAASLQKRPMDFVMCHNDAHPGNYLVTETGELYLVDWDNPIFAPKERDLMFFGAGMSGDQPGGREERWFYHGYRPVEINMRALAYYRFERIIQDIAEFCKQILLTTNREDDRAQSYQYFTSSFLPGSVVDAAFQTDQLGGGLA